MFSNSSKSYDTDKDSCCYLMPPFSRPFSRHGYRRASGRIGVARRGRDTLRCSTSTKDRRWSSRRRECIRRDRRVCGVRLGIDGFLVPVEDLMSCYYIEGNDDAYVRSRCVALKVWFDRLVLFVEKCQVRH